MIDWQQDPYNWAKGKSGIIYTEEFKVKESLNLRVGAEDISSETISLYEGGDTRTYYKLRVHDLWQAYAVMNVAYLHHMW